MPMVFWLKPFFAIGRMEICAGTSRAVRGMEHHLDLGTGLGGPFQQRSKHRPVRRREIAAEGTADHLLQRALDHPGEALVGVQNRLVGRERQSALVHGFDEHAVGVLGAFQREHAGTLLARDHDRIHVAAADRVSVSSASARRDAERGELAGRTRSGGAPLPRRLSPRALTFGVADPAPRTGRSCPPGCR